VRHILKILFSLSALLLSLNTNATGIVGSHVGYKAIDSVTYEVILTLYKECGTHPDTARIEIRGKSSGVFTSLAHKVSVTDITGAYLGCNVKGKCNGGTGNYGFDKVIYKDTVNISGGACGYVFGYSECCRDSLLTCGARTTHYNYATINKCYGINNSLQADIEPQFNVALGWNVVLSSFVQKDTIDKNDSIGYKQQRPSTSYPISYTTFINCGWWHSYLRPITFLGFPNAGLNSPAGFRFDELSGEYSFRPTLNNQRGLLYTEAIEYRKINGVMQIIGTTRLEHIVIVDSVGNKPPRIYGRSAVACANQELCIEFETNDWDKNDTVSLQILGAPKNAIITYDTSKRLATAKLCWTPTKDDISNIPKHFVVIATDNSCTVTGRTNRTFSINTRQSPDTSTFEVVSKKTQCSSAEIKLNMKNKSLPGLNIYYIDEDSVSYSQLFQPRLYFKGNGWKKFHISLSTSSPCTYIHTDSVFITPKYNLQFNTKNDTAVCDGDSVTVFTYPTNGTAPYKYSWGGSYWYNHNDSNIFKTLVDQEKSFKASVIDSNHCIGFTDTIFLKPNPIPVISAGFNDSVCPNAVFGLTATHDTTIQTPHFSWKGLDTLQTVSTQTTSNKWYYVTATSAEGCIYTDSTLRSVRSIGVDAGTYTSLCSGTPRQLTATSLAGIMPFKYTWLNTGDSTSTLNIAPTKDTIYIVRIEDVKGCFTYDTTLVKATAYPTFTAPNDTFICKGDSIVLSATNVNAAQPYQFKWNTVKSDSTFTHATINATNYLIELIDANNCKTTDAVLVNVFNKPTVSVSTDKTVCKGKEVFVISNALGGKAPYKYQWSNGETKANYKQVIHNKETLKLKLIDANGCFVIDSVTYDTFPTQKAPLIPLANPFCDNAPPIGLKNGAFTGTWTGAGVNSKIFNPKTAGAGVHTLQFNFTSIYNCPEQGEIIAVVKQTPQPNFTVDKTKGIPNTLFAFTNQTLADTTYTSEWNMGDGSNILTTQNVNHTYTKVGKYTVTLRVNNGVCPIQSITKSNVIEIDSIINFIPNTQKSILNIFPIPATTVLNVVGNEEIARVLLTDLQGKQVIEKRVLGSKSSIAVEHIPKGMYIITIELKSGTKHRNKILITH
jgi:PKD repeat protein